MVSSYDGIDKRGLLSCKWVLSIIKELADGPLRPRDLLKRIDGISERTLHGRLCRLVNLNLIVRSSNNSYPLVTHYRIKEPLLKKIGSLLVRVSLPPEEVGSILSCKYTLQILRTLNSTIKPKDVLKNVRDIPEKTLYNRLKGLESLGLIKREVLPSKPVSVTYSLTEEGREILPSLEYLSTIILSIQRRQNPCPAPAHDI